MFGLPNFNLDEMAKMVADFQVRHERMVKTIEALEAKLDLLIFHSGIICEAPDNKEVIEHDDSN